MSTYAQFGEDGNQYQIASNLGWSDCGDWIDSLDHEAFPALVSFWEHGIAEEIHAIKEELDRALESQPPKPDVQTSMEAFLSALHQNEEADCVLVTR